jgi:hypothetical protein
MLCSGIHERLRLAATMGLSRQHRESIGLGFSLCIRVIAGAYHDLTAQATVTPIVTTVTGWPIVDGVISHTLSGHSHPL